MERRTHGINNDKVKTNQPQDFNTDELFKGIYQIGTRFIQNYLNNAQGYYHDNRDISLTYFSFFTKLFAEPRQMLKVQCSCLDFLQEQQELWKNIFLNGSNTEGDHQKQPLISPKKGDNRFKANQWLKYPFFDFLKQNHLLVEHLALTIVDEVELEGTIKRRLDFYTKQFAELLSPANFLVTNPEAIELALETDGASLWSGFQNFVRDVEKGRITQVDQSAFGVGENLAITPGDVIFENELIQLIQYTPSTGKISEIPLLIIPPWINKYYILDLQPENSLVRFLVAQGFSVFIISWKNPTPQMGSMTFDDYVNMGALKAIQVVKDVCNISKINAMGYCLGGTLLGVAGAILAARKEKVLNSLTFLAAMIDFSDIGPMGNVINPALVKKLERGELLKDGIMHGHDMERAFNLIRAKDMIWGYAVNNYLKGFDPPAFDVMYWTNDNTNLPARMYIYYMKEMILSNKLRQKNELTICNTLIDITTIEAPVFIIAMEKDYISPPQTVFTTSKLVSGPVEFILGESGHVMGVANPPEKRKYGYYLNGKLGKGFIEWKKTAEYNQGSWWTLWSTKLQAISGEHVTAPIYPGNEKYKKIESAPGQYAKEKCEINLYGTNRKPKSNPDQKFRITQAGVSNAQQTKERENEKT